MSSLTPDRPQSDALIVERMGAEAIVFDPRTDEVHHLSADAVEAFTAAKDDVSRRNLLRGGLLVGGAAAITSMLAPTAASAMCVPGSAGPLGSSNGFNAFTALSGTYTTGDTQVGQYSAFVSTGTPSTTSMGSTSAMTWTTTGTPDHFVSGGGSTLAPGASGAVMTISAVGNMGLVFNVPSSGYLFGTGASVLTTNVVTNTSAAGGGTHNIAWYLYKVSGATISQVVGATTVAKNNTTSNIQSAIDGSGFAGLITVGAHKAVPVAAGDQMVILVRFTDTSALAANVTATWQ